MTFELNKQNALSKMDKSKKGSIDPRIISFLDVVNALDAYYTSSSCSGRICLFKEGERKNEGEWLFVSHDPVKPEQIKLEGDRTWFRMEPAIVHVACKTLDDAQKLLEAARNTGFKGSGIISVPKCTVEIKASERIDVPVECITNLNVLVEHANKKLETVWAKLERLKDQISTFK